MDAGSSDAVGSDAPLTDGGPTILPATPVLWFPFESIENQMLTGTNGNQATVGSNAELVPGVRGSGLFLGGSERAFFVEPTFLNELEQGTITFWATVIPGSGFSGWDVFGADTSVSCSRGLHLHYRWESLRILWVHAVDVTWCNTTDFDVTARLEEAATGWRHVAYVVSDSDHAIYLDGVLASLDYDVGDSTNHFFFSDYASSDTMYWLDGNRGLYLDEFRIYDRPLSADEVVLDRDYR